MPVPDLESFGDGFHALVAFREVDAVPEGRHLGAGVQGGGGLEGERHGSQRDVCVCCVDGKSGKRVRGIDGQVVIKLAFLNVLPLPRRWPWLLDGSIEQPRNVTTRHSDQLE